MSSVRNSNKAESNEFSGFICETEVTESDGTTYHSLHNPISGVWKKSKVCVK